LQRICSLGSTFIKAFTPTLTQYFNNKQGQGFLKAIDPPVSHELLRIQLLRSKRSSAGPRKFNWDFRDKGTTSQELNIEMMLPDRAGTPHISAIFPHSVGPRCPAAEPSVESLQLPDEK
jgi:hypothetical protein